MKVHRYKVKVYEVLERLFIPGRGLISYRSKDQIDFFSDNPQTLAQAQAIIESRGNGEYLGEIDLPDEEVLQAISAGKSLNQARTTFEQTSKSLIEKIK